jgi:hypothetical protein
MEPLLCLWLGTMRVELGARTLEFLPCLVACEEHWS